MAQVKLMMQAEYARHRGCSEAAVSKAVKEKRITLTADGLIDPVAADLQWARNTRVRAGSGQSSGADASVLADAAIGVAGLESAARGRELGESKQKPGDEDYWKNRGRREAADAERSELELAKLKGEQIEVLSIEKIWAQRMSQTRSVLQQVRSRLSPRLAAESDVRKIDEMLEAEHDAALRAMAGQMAIAHEEAQA